MGSTYLPSVTTSTALYNRFILPPEPLDPAAACLKLNLGCLTPSIAYVIYMRFEIFQENANPIKYFLWEACQLSGPQHKAVGY